VDSGILSSVKVRPFTEYSMSIKVKIFWIIVYFLAFVSGWFVGEIIFSRVAYGAELQHYQYSFTELPLTDTSSVSFVISCPNRDVVFTEFSYFGRHAGSGAQNVTLTLPTQTVVKSVSASPSLLQVFTLSSPVTCNAGSTIPATLSAPVNLNFYQLNPPAQATNQSASLIPANDILFYLASPSTPFSTLLSFGVTETIADTPTTTSSSTTTTQVVSFYSDSQTLFFGISLFFLGLWTVLFIVRRKK